MNKSFYYCLFSLFVFYSHITTGTTDKYRIMWRSDPATTMVIGWNQVSGSNPMVYYGTTDNGTNFRMYPLSRKPDRVVSHNGMANHFVRLTGLKPNTAYYFVIKDNQGVSRRLWFKTAPNDPSAKLSIIAGGDSRDSRTQRQNANKLVSKLRPHMVLFGGDMTRSNYDEEWKTWFDDWQLTIGSDGRMIPVVVARGNHEDSDAIIVNHFDVPHANVYYALTLGGSLLRVYTLNTETSIAGDQTNWLSSDLTNHANVTWKMAQYHRPMRPHVSTKSDGNTQYQYWASLFYQHKVKVVIECDAHTVKSTWPVVPSTGTGSYQGFIRNDSEGTVYLGEGCWGAPLRANDDDKPWTRNSGMFNQFNWVIVSKDKIEARVVKTDNADQVGSVSDSNIFLPPANLDIWNPSNGSVIMIQAPASTEGQTRVTAAVGAGTDDAEERADGTVYVGSTDLELVYDNSTTGNQTVGIRFPALSIPRGATISSAYIQFTADEALTGTTSLMIRGEAVDNSAPFNAGTNNVSARSRTAAAVTWSPAAWSSIGQASIDQQTPDIKNIVQEIVDRGGWNSGNALGVIITGTGKRTASSYEKSPQSAPVIKVTYTPPSGTGTTTTSTYAIVSGTDDVEQRADGSVYVASTDLELVYDNQNTGNQVAGLRFRNIKIPKGAEVRNAYLLFTSDEPATGSTSLLIRGEDTDNAAAFTTEAYNVSSRPLTTAQVSWSPPSWGIINEVQQSPDVRAVVQEVINRSAWREGNSLAFIIKGTGRRTAKSFDGSGSSAPKLVVRYTVNTSAASEVETTVLPERVDYVSVKVSPNPAAETAVLHFGESFNGRLVSYSFVTQSGGTALSSSAQVNESNQLEVDVRSLEKGLYILKILTSDGRSSLKFVKK
jgi:acid phosphatase type 7